MTWLQNTVTILTGGGSGLGKALVGRFIEEGGCVGVLERDSHKARLLREEFGDRVVVVTGDATRYDDNISVVQATVERFGRIDTFIGNAGVFDFNETLEEMDPARMDASFHELFDINVKAPLLGVKACLSDLSKSKGNVILTLSCAAFYPGGGGPLYTASKHALHGIVKQLAYELAPSIRVNGVAPGAMLTELGGLQSNDTLQRRLGDPERASDFDGRVATLNPLNRSFVPDEYCGPYVLLASGRNASALTGVVINADGGMGVKGIKPLERPEI